MRPSFLLSLSLLAASASLAAVRSVNGRVQISGWEHSDAELSDTSKAWWWTDQYELDLDTKDGALRIYLPKGRVTSGRAELAHASDEKLGSASYGAAEGGGYYDTWDNYGTRDSDGKLVSGTGHVTYSRSGSQMTADWDFDAKSAEGNPIHISGHAVLPITEEK